MQTVLTHNSELAVLPVLWLRCFICRRQKQAPGKAEGMLLPFSCPRPLACLRFVFLGGAAKTNMLWGVAARVAPCSASRTGSATEQGREEVARWLLCHMAPGTSCASYYILLAGCVQWLLLGHTQKYLLNIKVLRKAMEQSCIW